MDNNMFNFGEIFGDSDFIFTPVEEKKPEKKAEKPAKAPKAKKAETFSLPLKVYSGYLNFTLEGEGELTLEELKERIFQKSMMFAPKIIQVEKHNKENGAVFVKFKGSLNADLKFDKKYTIVLNDFKIELDPDQEDAEAAFDALDLDASTNNNENDEDEEKEDEKNLIAIAEKRWIESYPDFEGATFVCDEDKQVIVPIMMTNCNITDKNQIKIPFEYEVFGGESGSITTEDIPNKTEKTTVFVACDKLKEKIGIACGLFKTKEGKYYVVPQNSVGSGTVSSAPKEKMFKTNSAILFYGERVEINASMFGGKEEVSEKDLLKWICSAQGGGHDEYDPKRGSWLDFFEEKNLIIPRFPAARKGGYIIDEEGFRCQETAVGSFRVRTDVAESKDNSFSYKLPKIPVNVWSEVVDFFA